MNEQLLETWRIHSRINLYILDSIPSEAFAASKPTKGRSFAEMFAHQHNVRLMWLQTAAPDLAAQINKIEKGIKPDKEMLHNHLSASAVAIEKLLTAGLENGRIKGFKPHPPAFLSYLIAHESYHHGEIGIALTQIGYPLDKKVAFGMWEWGTH